MKSPFKEKSHLRNRCATHRPGIWIFEEMDCVELERQYQKGLAELAATRQKALEELEHKLKNEQNLNEQKKLRGEIINLNEQKKLRGEIINLNTEYNKTLRRFEKDFAKKIYARFCELEATKVNGFIPDQHLDEVKNLYLLLPKLGRLSKRYLKLPKAWIKIGMYAGILEELIVILRTASQMGMGHKHLHTVEELQTAIRKYNQEDLHLRFLFLTMLCEQSSTEHVKKVLDDAIRYQDPSFRIGIFKDGKDTFVYAIQGIYGGVAYDNRVVKTVTPDNLSEIPRFGVHFTKEQIANAIWNRILVKAPRTRKKPLTPGSIAKFDRAIHALTCVEKGDDGKMRIHADKTGIRDRMVNGINDTVNRQKYQAGLVIDIHKLSRAIPNGCVQINELGTLLVTEDIPPDCLVMCLISDEDLNTFWRLSK
jgi:hypothetical protein